MPPLNISQKNPDTSINWAHSFPLSSSPAFFHDNRLPYAEHYNFSLQRQFGSATIISVSYVGTQAHRLLWLWHLRQGGSDVLGPVLKELLGGSYVEGTGEQEALATVAVLVSEQGELLLLLDALGEGLDRESDLPSCTSVWISVSPSWLSFNPRMNDRSIFNASTGKRCR